MSGAISNGNKVNLKNHYHEIFLAYFWLALKKHHVIFTDSDCIYNLFRLVLKHKIIDKMCKLS